MNHINDHTRGDPRDPATDAERRVREAGQHATDRIHNSATRTADAAEQATARVRSATRAVNARLTDPGRTPAFVRDRPLAAAGIAFGVGLLLGLGRDTGDRSWVVRKAAKKIRGTVLSGLSAAVIHELRSLVDPAWLE